MKLKLMAAAVLTGFGAFAAPAARATEAAAPSFTFASIEGGVIDTAAYRGHPVLVVNTASLCGFTRSSKGCRRCTRPGGRRG